MTIDNDTEFKNNPAKPVKTFRQGAIGASVWSRRTNTGFPYYDFSLSRSWKSSTSGGEGYSPNFFAQNEDELIEVIRQASEWILSQQSQSDQSSPTTAQTTHEAA